MVLDVFYFGKKPNAHPRELPASSLSHARQQSTTEHFWIINEFCDYKGFDWDFDFEFLPDEDVWAEEHNNVWPSNHQADSGTWLCPKEHSDVIVYRADVPPIARKNEHSDCWVLIDLVDQTKFDFSWHPDPREPAYIYVWGNKWNPVELAPSLEYHVPGATERKYMSELVEIMPDMSRWNIIDTIDKIRFDFTWIPDPREPAYIYTWGNKHVPVELAPSLEYHVPGATERKYMSEVVELIPDMTRWNIIDNVDTTTFDLTWRPDPREPPYIYVWGNKWNPVELAPSLEYHVPGATERKYMNEFVELIPDMSKWNIIDNIDRTTFDLTWMPDPREPAYIYTWGNRHVPVELAPSLEYHCPGATERKYMTELVDLLPDMSKWNMLHSILAAKFDLSWMPDPREPAYIYVWGNKHVPVEIAPSIEYHVPGATERKYMSELVDLFPDMSKWNIIDNIDRTTFDLTWRPDPREPAYIYVWGNKHVPVELAPSLEYHVPGATERKYMTEIVELIPDMSKWNVIDLVDKTKFDLTWIPDPREPAFIYVWGNKHVPVGIAPSLEYHCTGATERKYMSEVVELLPTYELWKEHIPVDTTKFDLTWIPDPREPAYIYTWGNKFVSAELKPTIEYHCTGATERKYMGDAAVLPQWNNYVVHEPIHNLSFDFTWMPDPREPAYIYVWGNKHVPAELKPTVEYHVPGATERKYMKDIVEVLPEFDKWKETQLVDREKFDMSWRPDPREPAYIYVWGNKHIPAELVPTVEYYCPGATERKYMGNAEVLPQWDQYKIIVPLDKTTFDFTWRPDPRDPAYIYTWGNQSNSAELEPTLEYHCLGATERKYMSYTSIKTTPVIENWKILIPVETFDFSWRPDPTSPPYIYVFGNQWHSSETEPTVEYHVAGATERKYTTVIAQASKTQEHWKTLIPVESFDYSWRPNPHSSPFIYVFGNQWNEGVIEPTVEYHTPGATDRKYITDVIALVKSTSTTSNWKKLISIESFDYSWRPDPTSPPYIYVFGNKWNDSSTEPTVEYHVEGATDRKYMTSPVATPNSQLNFWSISNNDDLLTFDFSWRPNPFSPPQIYQWANNGPRYTVPGATEVVFVDGGVTRKAVVNRYKIETTLEDLIAKHADEVFWAINPDLKYDKFNFNWKPNEENFRHINVFGNEYSKNTQTYYVNGPMYAMGYKKINYVEEQTVDIDSNLSMFFIDHSNKESTTRFNELKLRYPQLIKTRYLNSWVDTITRCVNKSSTALFWVLDSNLSYTNFEFDFYPSPWQMKMVHVFGTQWSHWGTTFMINKETFIEDTKYVKIIEHLSMLNFVKSKKATAVDTLYDIIYIDHGNKDTTEAEQQGKIVVKYETSYLNTFKNILEILPTKKAHYIWVTSSICDYTQFDFSYICDPYAKDQLHVFPSDKQKFGDTFLIDVCKLRILIDSMTMLEDYEKINFNPHQRVARLPAPKIVMEEDTHDISKYEFNFPYADFVTKDSTNIVVNNETPMSVWSPEHKILSVKSTGGTVITVPKEAKSYVKRELYDYPYISKATKLVKSNPLDIVFLSNGETKADENYEHLLKVTKHLPNKVKRVDGVDGRVAAYHAAANASDTAWALTVFAKLRVNPDFDWSWQPDRLQVPKHYIFHATNPVNGLEYGHQGMIAYNKKLTLANTGVGLDFTLDDEHEVVEINSGTAVFNTDAWSTWRTSFREAIKLRGDTGESKFRLHVWLTKGAGDFAEFSIEGARHAIEYYEEVAGDPAKLRLSYDWAWLREKFNTLYPNN